ncbi:hypothetical protein EGY31_04260 [Burkholderia multivorans]|nr:hypothetical protein EGY31_04260 [Burkholderia multivorans]VWB53431.1 putative PAS/PAC sensor protein [Burkholderia ubonensis]
MVRATRRQGAGALHLTGRRMHRRGVALEDLSTNTTRSRPGFVAALFWAALYLASGYISHLFNGPVRMTGYSWLLLVLA